MMTLEIGERRRVEAQAPARPRSAVPHLLVEAPPGGRVLPGSATSARDDTDIADVELYTSPRIEDRSGSRREEWHRRRPLLAGHGCTPTTVTACLPLAEHSIADGRAVQRRVPLPRRGRPRRLGARARDAARTRDDARACRVFPGRHARHHRAQESRGEGPRRRGAVPPARRARTVRRVRVRARARRSTDART